MVTLFSSIICLFLLTENLNYCQLNYNSLQDPTLFHNTHLFSFFREKKYKAYYYFFYYYYKILFIIFGNNYNSILMKKIVFSTNP